MKTKYTNKQIWMIAYPILISLLMEQMIGMTDTAFLGRVGEVELGASAIAGVFYMVIFMAAFGFSIGAQILIARRNGEKQYREIGDLFYQGIYFQIGLAAVMFLLSYFLSPMILKRIVSSEHIYEAAISYLNWRVFGAFFSFSAVIFRAFFLGTTQTKTLTLNSIVMVLSNVVFNYILIFGKFGFPALGIAGAAIGSSLAELVSLIFFILYTRYRIDCRKFGPYSEVPPGDTETHAEHFLLDHDTERLLLVHLVLVLPLCGASGRTVARHHEHCPEHIRHSVHGNDGICLNLWFIGQQSHRCRRQRLRGRHYPAAYTHCISVHIAASTVFCTVPKTYTGNLYGYTRFTGCSRTFTLGNVLGISVSRTCQCIFPGSIRNGKHAHGFGHGTNNARLLYLKLDVALCWTSEMVYSIFILLLCWWYIKGGRWQEKRI